MKNFSLTKYSMDKFIKQNDLQKELDELKKSSLGFKIDEFKGKDAAKDAIEERKMLSEISFWNFDKFYFPPLLYEDYAAPNSMLKDIVKASSLSGFHLFLGPRKHGKTVTAKKLLLWLLLTGKVNTAGIYSETIFKSSKILKNIFLILSQNAKLLQDYKFEVINANSDEFQIKMLDGQNNPIRSCAAFSEGRSLRGYSDIFSRPQFLLGDDVETLESSFAANAVETRIMKLSEAFHSLNKNGTFLILANDFINTSAMHQLKIQKENNLLPNDWNVYSYKAFNKIPLWHQKFGRITESQLKDILKPLSESDWQANFQNNPVPPDGDFFKRQNYQEYFSLPNDVKGIIYCDPNLSKKGKGDTTAIVPLLYSPHQDIYFVPQVICKSFNDANQLIDSVFQLKQSVNNITGIAFDGNVSQESTWSQHIKNYTKINSIPFPHIEYKRYRVNDLAKNLQLAYADNKIKFAPGFSKTPDGEKFLSQFFAFSGTKKESSYDDAPDALICAFEFIHERKLVKQFNQPVKTFKDYYQL